MRPAPAGRILTGETTVAALLGLVVARMWFVMVLLTRAEGQAGLVVGRRGRGGFAGLLLGSVSQQVAVHATCPVVVVPGGHAPATDEPSNGAGAVVVGVDGSQHARRALVRAAEEAAVREALLDVVIVSPLPPPPAGIEDITIEASSGAIWPTSAPGLAGLELSRRMRTAQAHAAAEWQEEVRWDVEHDLRRLDRAPEYKLDIVTGLHPAEALIEAASAADLLVVGSRGYGGFAGMLIGSVSQHCVRHARVPVMVMPQG